MPDKGPTSKSVRSGKSVKRKSERRSRIPASPKLPLIDGATPLPTREQPDGEEKPLEVEERSDSKSSVAMDKVIVPPQKLGPGLPVSPQVMDSERWVEHRMDTLRMRSFLGNELDRLPPKIEKRMLQFDANERNSRGETVIIGVIRYLTDPTRQVKHLNLLMRAGCDANLSETKHNRTPLMFACMDRNEGVVRWLLTIQNVDLIAQDRLGNTALMYAALYGHSNIVNLLVDSLTRKWSFDVFRVRNCMGHTAESLARKNDRTECATLLRRERLQMLQRMHRQLALIHLSADMKGWGAINMIHKAKDAFLQRSPQVRLRSQHHRRKFNEKGMADNANSEEGEAEMNENTTMSDKSLSVQRVQASTLAVVDREKSASEPSISGQQRASSLPDQIFKAKYKTLLD